MYGFNLDELMFLKGKKVEYIIVHRANVVLMFVDESYLEFGGFFCTANGCFDIGKNLEGHSEFVLLINTRIKNILVSKNNLRDMEDKYEIKVYENDILEIEFDNDKRFIFYDYPDYEFMSIYNKAKDIEYIC